jgi:hypothetical protein
MTEPVVCKKGKCEYTDEKMNQEWKPECIDCELEEQIEYDLIVKPVKRSKK